MRTATTFFTLILFTILFLACSKENSDIFAHKANDKPRFMDKRSTIAGVDLSGDWLSICNFIEHNDSYRRFRMNVDRDKVTRTATTYVDSACLSEIEEVSYTGNFRFIDFYEVDNSYEIEYAFGIGNGITIFPLEKVLLKHDKLYISNYSTGELGQVLKDESLYKQ